jgi:polar amino acid transport system substrate-binding protein
MKKLLTIVTLLSLLITATNCNQREKITDFSQLEGKEFAVPTGTVADQLVLSTFPQAKFRYFNTVLDACMAVKGNKADAAAYDEPILRNIAAKNSGLKVLPKMITTDHYGYAVKKDNQDLMQVIDEVLAEMRSNGTYDEMINRWLPDEGEPKPMPEIKTGSDGVLVFGTSATTEPFSFVRSQEIVGLDIEIASRVAAKLNKELKIVNMDFGAMIPALDAGKVDMIGALITITEERAEKVLFSEPYYTGGIAALVKE